MIFTFKGYNTYIFDLDSKGKALIQKKGILDLGDLSSSDSLGIVRVDGNKVVIDVHDEASQLLKESGKNTYVIENEGTVHIANNKLHLQLNFSASGMLTGGVFTLKMDSAAGESQQRDGDTDSSETPPSPSNSLDASSSREFSSEGDPTDIDSMETVFGDTLEAEQPSRRPRTDVGYSAGQDDRRDGSNSDSGNTTAREKLDLIARKMSAIEKLNLADSDNGGSENPDAMAKSDTKNISGDDVQKREGLDRMAREASIIESTFLSEKNDNNVPEPPPPPKKEHLLQLGEGFKEDPLTGGYEYTVKSFIGKGGFGEVYQVVDRQGNPYALKVLNPEITRGRENVFKLFDNEVSIGRFLEFPALVRTLESSFDVPHQLRYCVMAFVDGVNFAHVIAYLAKEGKRMHYLYATWIVLKVAEVLEFLSSNGVVHRDIKTQNVMVNRQGDVKVMDLGIARQRNDSSPLKPNEPLGTLSYLPMGQLHRKDPVDVRLDIYCLGVMYYWLLTNKAPIQEPPAECDSRVGYYREMTGSIYRDPSTAPDPKKIERKIPSDVSKIVMKMMEQDVDKRYKTADDLIQDLEKITRRYPAKEIRRELALFCKAVRNEEDIPLPDTIMPTLLVSAHGNVPKVVFRIEEDGEQSPQSQPSLQPTQTLAMEPLSRSNKKYRLVKGDTPVPPSLPEQPPVAPIAPVVTAAPVVPVRPVISRHQEKDSKKYLVAAGISMGVVVLVAFLGWLFVNILPGKVNEERLKELSDLKRDLNLGQLQEDLTKLNGVDMPFQSRDFRKWKACKGKLDKLKNFQGRLEELRGGSRKQANALKTLWNTDEQTMSDEIVKLSNKIQDKGNKHFDYIMPILDESKKSVEEVIKELPASENRLSELQEYVNNVRFAVDWYDYLPEDRQPAKALVSKMRESMKGSEDLVKWCQSLCEVNKKNIDESNLEEISDAFDSLNRKIASFGSFRSPFNEAYRSVKRKVQPRVKDLALKEINARVNNIISAMKNNRTPFADGTVGNIGVYRDDVKKFYALISDYEEISSATKRQCKRNLEETKNLLDALEKMNKIDTEYELAKADWEEKGGADVDKGELMDFAKGLEEKFKKNKEMLDDIDKMFFDKKVNLAKQNDTLFNSWVELLKEINAVLPPENRIPEEVMSRQNVIVSSSSRRSNYLIIDLETGKWRFSEDEPEDIQRNNVCRSTEMWLRRIPSGTFRMGSQANNEHGWMVNETPQHEVTLDEFYMGIFECTQKQWTLLMGRNPSFNLEDDHPVEQVTIEDIRGVAGYKSNVKDDSFMGRLRKMAFQNNGNLFFDLPTEAQWEYACRANTESDLNSGENLTEYEGADPALDKLGRYRFSKKAFVEHVKVGSYEPNDWGLYDMHGNVFEWCLDWSGDYDIQRNENPVGPDMPSQSPKYCILRGGGYKSKPAECRSAYRAKGRTGMSENTKDEDAPARGFRIVCPRPQTIVNAKSKAEE